MFHPAMIGLEHVRVARSCTTSNQSIWLLSKKEMLSKTETNIELNIDTNCD